MMFYCKVVLGGMCCFFLFMGLRFYVSSKTQEPVQVYANAVNREVLLRSAKQQFLEETDGKEPPPVILIDPGHGGVDGGCSWEEILEKDINLKIAERLKGKLEHMGYQAVMMREGDTYLSKEERVECANRIQPDILISIHQNSFEMEEVNGIETWYDSRNDAEGSERLARMVHREIIKSTGALERELKEDGEFCVLSNTMMASCLVETGFITNEEERKKLLNPEYQERIAEGIGKGIAVYFNQ